MKIMRSTRTGSTCADCATPILIGDPIAYFGPRAVYGLTCHINDKTVKHLATLRDMENAVQGKDGPTPRVSTTSPNGLPTATGTAPPNPDSLPIPTLSLLQLGERLAELE